MRVRLDLNNEVFQQEWFALEKVHRISVLEALVKLASLSWDELYKVRGSAGNSFKAVIRQMAPVSTLSASQKASVRSRCGKGSFW